MVKRYRVTLSCEERIELEGISNDGKTFSKKYINARALLLCDAGEGGPHWPVKDVACALGVSARKIEHLKRRFVEDGLEVAICRKQRETPPITPKYDGAFDARLTQLACSEAPSGHSRWTVRLLSEKIVELGIMPSCSPMTVFRSLKKTNFSLTAANTGKSRRTRALAS